MGRLIRHEEEGRSFRVFGFRGGRRLLEHRLAIPQRASAAASDACFVSARRGIHVHVHAMSMPRGNEEGVTNRREGREKPGTQNGEQSKDSSAWLGLRQQ